MVRPADRPSDADGHGATVAQLDRGGVHDAGEVDVPVLRGEAPEGG